MASDSNLNNSAGNSVAVTADTASSPTPDQAPAPMMKHEGPPPTPEGLSWRTIVGDKFIDKTGLKVDFIFEGGFSANNVSDSSVKNSGGGSANFPNGQPGDLGFQLQSMWTFVHRDAKSNMLPRITPIPPPMFKHFDWGFDADGFYGRSGQPCGMPGFDQTWGINEPGASNPAAANATKQNFLCMPNAYGQIYFPVFKGIEITGGRYGDGLGFEIPPQVTHGPNFFYSHTYAFYSSAWQVVGVLATANLMHSPKNGYLMAEFGLNNGEQLATSGTGNTMEGYEGALRWKAPHMNSSIDYSFRAASGNIKTVGGAPINPLYIGPVYPILSPVNQNRWRQDLVLQHEFTRKLSAQIEGLYWKQDGNKANTVNVVVGGPFGGDHAAGVNGRVVYNFNPKFGVGARLEAFHDQNGFFLLPLNLYHVATESGVVAKESYGTFTDATFGVNFNPIPNIRIRPEIRFDHNGNGAFGSANALVFSGTNAPKDNMTSFNMDLIFMF
jgi:hypothetical protein